MNGKLPFAKRGDPLSLDNKETRVVEEKPKFVEEEKKVAQPAPKPVKKVVVVEEDDANREKYTATMDKMLRRRIKIAAINSGMQVSSFIEQACLEKLEREGL